MSKARPTSTRWFRRLLRLFPSEFRTDYGPGMEQVFRDQLRESETRGSRLRLWSATLRDVAMTAPREHLRILVADLRYAARMMRKNPGPHTVAVITLALGIGATTAVFSIVHQVVLQALPYPEPDRLVYLWCTTKDDPHQTFSGPDFYDMAEQVTAFEATANLAGIGSTTISGDAPAERVKRLIVPPSYFRVLGIRPLLGRDFLPGDKHVLPAETIQSPPGPDYPVGAMIISHGLWQRRFGGSPDVLGTVVQMDRRPQEIVGVLPPGFRVLLPAELGADPRRDAFYLTNWDQSRFPRDVRFMGAIARLRPDTTIGQAQAELDAFSRRQRETIPELADEGFAIRVRPLHEEVVREASGPLWILFGAVLAVLLIACANVSTLLLAVGAARRVELGLRAALGASRARLFRQLLTESLLLAFLGCGLGVLVARGGLALVTVILPEGLARFEGVRLDPVVLGFSLLVATVAALVFGTIPALQCSRPALERALGSGRRTVGGLQRQRGRTWLVAGEIALCFVLIVATGLLIRSFVAMVRVDPGFDARSSVVAVISLSGADYPEPHQRVGFYRALIEDLEAGPDGQTAGLADCVPVACDAGPETVASDADPEREHQVAVRRTGPGYFQALGIPLLRGRGLRWSDLERSPDQLSVVVAESTAELLWPAEDPVGRRMRVSRLDFSTGDGDVPLRQVWADVVGVVADVHEDGVRPAEHPRAYVSYNVNLWGSAYVPVRAVSGAEATVARIRATISRRDPDLAPTFFTLDEAYGAARAPVRFSMLLLGTFGGLGLALSAIGLYALLSNSVRQGTAEIGLRVAMGAGPGGILRLVLLQGLRPTGAGVALGAIGSIWVNRLLANQLFGVGPGDAWTLVSMTAIVGATAIVACGAPALRAVRVDPLTALRTE